MVTTVANTLFDRLIEEFPPTRPYGRVDLRSESMPHPIGDYLRHMLDLKIRNVPAGEPSDDSWVDTDAQEVEEARAAYLDAIERHQAIPADAWADALRTACHRTIRFLVRPASTAADAVFESTSWSVAADAVFQQLDYFPSYAYVRNVVEAYFERKDVSRIDRQRFEALVIRIDREMTQDFSPRQWRLLLDPLVALIEATGEQDVPLALLKPMLDEKGAEDALRRVKHRYGLDGFVPIEDLEDLFRPEETADDPAAVQSDVHRAQEQPAASSTDESLPLWKQFERGGRPPSREREPQAVDEEDADDSQPLWKQFRKTTAPSGPDETPSNLSDLERAVLGDRGVHNRDLFVRHLFSGRPEEYEATLQRLARAASWSQASQIIAKDIFLKHQVNIYSDPAVAFTDAAEAQYRS